MANTINFITCAFVTALLLISIALAGPHLLLPAVAMIVVILVGGLCIYVANSIIVARNKIEKEWETKNPE